MAKEPVNETPAAAAPVTVDQLLAVVREMIAANQMTPEKVREIATAATIDAYDKTSGKFWDIRNYPKVSDFNPAGDLEHPRGTLLGEVLWFGHKLNEVELTPHEIELLNRLEPGLYGPDGAWLVKDLQPGVRDRTKRRILVIAPCKDEDTRGRLTDDIRRLNGRTNSGPWTHDKTLVEQMCEVMVHEAAALVTA